MSAFGVDLGVVSKALPFARPKLKLATDPTPKQANPSAPKGPGSQRARLSQSAWATQTAAKRRV